MLRMKVSVLRYWSLNRELRAHCKIGMKRACDVVCSAILLLLLIPLFVGISVSLYVSGGRNIIFAHEREGKNRRRFKCLKFRTMRLDAEEHLQHILATDTTMAAEWQANRKLKNDPRIIPGIGTFLRKSSLDELPQLINVLKGDMSLVGPRPVIEDEIAYYGSAATYYYSVRPGMTGPWQVGSRSAAEYQTRVQQDTDYVKTWTIAGDFVIMLKTAKMVLSFKTDGAY